MWPVRESSFFGGVAGQAEKPSQFSVSLIWPGTWLQHALRDRPVQMGELFFSDLCYSLLDEAGDGEISMRTEKKQVNSNIPLTVSILGA